MSWGRDNCQPGKLRSSWTQFILVDRGQQHCGMEDLFCCTTTSISALAIVRVHTGLRLKAISQGFPSCQQVTYPVGERGVYTASSSYISPLMFLHFRFYESTKSGFLFLPISSTGYYCRALLYPLPVGLLKNDMLCTIVSL